MDIETIIIILIFVILPLAIIESIITSVKDVIKANEKNQKIKDKILNGDFIYYKDFENNWITQKQGNKGISGYKYSDCSGCYVILIFPIPIENNKFENYENVYIGQSVNICKRVHSHFNGKGKGDIYADIKYGKHAYVKFVPCPKEDMNKLEKELIVAFNATQSYNQTHGGAIKRY